MATKIFGYTSHPHFCTTSSFIRKEIQLNAVKTLEAMEVGSFIRAKGCDYILKKKTKKQWIVCDDFEYDNDREFVGATVTFEATDNVMPKFKTKRNEALLFYVYELDKKHFEKLYPTI